VCRPLRGITVFSSDLEHAHGEREESMTATTMNDAGYVAPAVADYGDLISLTGGATDGDATDADFPVHTPKSSLTFS
jgi:hypothetical protein